MKGLGIVVNVLAVVIGGSLGDMLRGRYRQRYQELIVQLCGMVAMVISIFGALTAMYDVGGEKLEMQGVLILVFALVTGTVFGTTFNIEGLLTRLGLVLKKLLGREPAAQGGENTPVKGKQYTVYELHSPRSGDLFADGFVIATVLVSFGALSVSGCMAEGGVGDTTILYIKSAVDFVLVFALATVFGGSATLAAFPMLLMEGIMTLLAVNGLVLAGGKLASQMAVISAIIMLAAGINLAFGKKLRAANMIPALVIPAIYYGIVDNVTLAVEQALGL